MASFLTSALASFSLMLRQPLSAFCDLETTDGRAFISKGGHYASWVRLDGMQRMSDRADFEAVTESMRLELSGALENKGHAMVGWYMSDPQAALVEIERVNLTSCRAVARELGLQFDDILDERARIWPTQMRWEAAYLVLWTRTSVLTKEERRQLRAEYAANAVKLGGLGSTQRTYLRNTVMAARHGAFVSRVTHSLRSQGVACDEVEQHDALRVAREVMYRETSGGDWRPTLPGDSPMPRLPAEGSAPTGEHLLWPTIPDQLFYTDAVTLGGHHVEFGENTVAPIDMTIGPEDPRPLVELVAPLGRDRIPWRTSFVIEGCGPSAMTMKKTAAQFLAMLRQARHWLTQPGSGEQGSSRWAKLRDSRKRLATYPYLGAPVQGHPGRYQIVVSEHRLIYRIDPDTGDTATAGDIRVLAVFGPGQP